MFFNTRPKKRKPDPNASLVNWIIIGVVALAVIGNFGKERPLPKEASPKALKESLVKAAPKSPIDFSNYQNLLPGNNAGLKIQEIETGEGKPAICGQKVSIAYEAVTAGDQPIKDGASKEKPLTFTIGGGKVMPALEQGVVGMKKDGIRAVYSPARMAYGLEGFIRDDVPGNTAVQFTVTLLDVTPELPDMEDNAFRIINVQRGVGPTILCGDAVKAHITVWSVDGRKLFSTRGEGREPITFTPGKSEMMLGLEQGAVGINLAGARTLIVPPPFQKTMNGNAPKADIPLPQRQTVLIDLEALP